ncbi:hypothetical protein [Halomonas elongata]|uniref:hypothetical protein n=1 Tax=Halomonas elongata TaxID=2746 RepID=UPI00186B619C|nr:hypothetical protein [Halomonas elongata]MBW5798621.1 hypothetical protein [Halomonas elongata]
MAKDACLCLWTPIDWSPGSIPHLTDRETIRHVVHHLPAERIIHWPVSTRVNQPGNDDASLIEFPSVIADITIYTAALG